MRQVSSRRPGAPRATELSGHPSSDAARPVLLRWAASIKRAYREQLAKEDRRLIAAQFTALDRTIGDVRPSLGAQADPLEAIWRLPAAKVRSGRAAPGP